MNSYKQASKIFGVLFILAFIAYGLGSGLIESLTSSAEGLSKVYVHKGQLVFGAILISVVHTFVNIVVASIILTLLKPYGRILAFSYFNAVITSTVMLVMGTIFLLLLIPISDQLAQADAVSTVHLQSLSLLCTKANFFSYQIGMAIWGFGGLILCYLLYVSATVPRLLSIGGFVGYLIFMTGTIAELFGHHIGVLFSIPGGLFEISLSIWFIVKGFHPLNKQRTTIRPGY